MLKNLKAEYVFFFSKDSAEGMFVPTCELTKLFPVLFNSWEEPIKDKETAKGIFELATDF